MSVRWLPPTPLLMLGAVAVVIGLAILVSLGMTDGFDRAVGEAIRADAVHGLLSPLRVLTELGSTEGVTLMAIVAVALGVGLHRWREGLAAALTIALASIGTTLFKIGIARERPELLDPIVVEHGFSFPSGHSMLSMVAYGVLAVLISRSTLPRAARGAIIGPLLLVVLAVGVSRVWLGVHHPTDVIAGWLTGAVIVLAYARLTRSGSTAPGGEAADGDRAAPRSDPPGPG